MKNLHIGIFAVLTLILISPLTTEAASTSAQSAVRLTDSHVLFTITYDIGFLNRATYAPVLANTGRTENEVSYSITAANGNKMYVPSAGFITATHAVVENNYYKLEYGKKSDFTLAVIAQIPKSETDYTLTITKMPFILIDKDKSTRLSEYTPENLKDYKTPGVK